jgi:hypothetical protein
MPDKSHGDEGPHALAEAILHSILYLEQKVGDLPTRSRHRQPLYARIERMYEAMAKAERGEMPDLSFIRSR